MRSGNTSAWANYDVSNVTIANWVAGNPIVMIQNYYPNNLSNFVLPTQEALLVYSTDSYAKTVQGTFPWC